MHNVSLPSVLRDAILKFDNWAEQQLSLEQKTNAIGSPLYHYTDWRGLQGIVESQEIWFTDYRHLNDPSELIHGIDVAHQVAHELATVSNGLVRMFLETFVDMFSPENLSKTLEFFIASFSRERNDLGQWRAYADNGRGFAIGFSPNMFSVAESLSTDVLGEFVGPVVYEIDEIRARYALAIERATAVFWETVCANASLLEDREIGVPFMQEIAKHLIASPSIWNCLTSKHSAYAHEREVRLIILGQREQLLPHIMTRLRGSENVPFIAHSMPLREPQSIVEIVVGPAAINDAERSLRTFLISAGIDPIKISRSDVPYRVL
jgi:hypothetical protein